MGIFELLARRDPILKELQDRIKNKNTKDHYLSPTIQNELIELLATEVEKENLQQLKLAQYFSIILDCTPDMSHHEEMSVILRYVLCNEEAAVVKETFFGYLRISDSTGKGLLDAFLEKATELQLELSDCRGQSYDNGANMKGKHSGVQARMLDINPKAVYVPCANHTLNLVVVDSANQSRKFVIWGPNANIHYGAPFFSTKRSIGLLFAVQESLRFFGVFRRLRAIETFQSSHLIFCSIARSYSYY